MARSGAAESSCERGKSIRTRVVECLSHAFAVGSESERLTPEDEEIVQRVAQAVARRGLAAPASMLLESVRPLNFLGSQTLAFFEPIASVILDASKCKRFRELLEKRSAVPALIDAIERAEEVTRDS